MRTSPWLAPIAVSSLLALLGACSSNADIARAGASGGDAARGTDSTTPAVDDDREAGAPDDDGGLVDASAPTSFAPIPAADIAAVGLGSAGDPVARELSITAYFRKGLTTDCVARHVGTCQITRCGQGGSGGAAVSAGTITVGATTLAPRPGKTYPPLFSAGAYPAGQMVHVEASGADVPAFSADVLAPTPLIVTSPAGGSLDMRVPLSGSLSKSADFALAWVANQGEVSAQVYQHWGPSGGKPSYFVACRFDAASGKGVIPRAALSDLTVGAGPTTELQLNISSDVVKTVGGYAVTVSASERGSTFEAVGGVAP